MKMPAMYRKRREYPKIREEITKSQEREAAQREQTEAFLKEKSRPRRFINRFSTRGMSFPGRSVLLDKELFRLNQQLEKLNESQEQKISYMWEEYEITPNNAKSYWKEEMQDGSGIKKEIGRSRKKSESLEMSMSMPSKITRAEGTSYVSVRPVPGSGGG